MTDAVMTPVAGVDLSAEPAPAPAAEPAKPEAEEIDPFLAFEEKDEFSEPDEAAPDADEPDADEEPVEALDTKKYEVESADGTKKKMTVGEMQKALKVSGMFQADHTRKTQELAEGRKELSRMVSATKAEAAKNQQAMNGVREFFGAISKPDADPYYVMRMLEREGIPVRGAVTRVVEDVLREQNLPEQDRQTREHERRKRAALAEEKYHEERVAKAKRAAESHARQTQQQTQQQVQQQVQQQAQPALGQICRPKASSFAYSVCSR